MARESAVGNSQSDVKEATQKRVLVLVKGARQHAAMIGRQIEIIHRAGEIEIGIGVKPLNKRNTLIAQIAFNLKIGIERKCRRVTILQIAARISGAGRFLTNR